MGTTSRGLAVFPRVGLGMSERGSSSQGNVGFKVGGVLLKTGETKSCLDVFRMLVEYD